MNVITTDTYLTFDISHETDVRILSLIVSEKRGENIIIVDNYNGRIKGDYIQQMMDINNIVEEYSKKYNCKVLKEC